MSADGSQLIYSTLLTGSLVTNAMALALDGFGDAFVTGSTFSPNFHVTPNGQFSGTGNVGAFVTELNSTGSAVVYSAVIPSDGTGNAVSLSGVRFMLRAKTTRAECQ